MKILAVFLLAAGAALADPSSSPTATPSPSPSPAPTPIAISSVIAEADKTTGELAKIQGDVATDNGGSDLQKFVPRLTSDIDARELQTARILRTPARINVLQDLATSWIVLREDLTLRQRLLNDQLTSLDTASARLADLTALWTATRNTLAAQNDPGDILDRVTTILQQLSSTNTGLVARRTKLLNLQSALADQNTRINQELATVQQARGSAMAGLLGRDSPPLWQFSELRQTHQAVAEKFSPYAQARETVFWLIQERGLIGLHAIIWIGLILLFRRAQKKVRHWVETDPGLKASTTIFEIPATTASLLALWIAFFLYAGAPPIFTALLGAALLVPLMGVINRIVERPLRPVIWALAAFYLASQLRDAAAPFVLLARFVHLAEAVLGIIFALWLIRGSHFSELPSQSLPRKTIAIGAHLGLLFFTAAAVANILGYVNLAIFVGSVVLQSAYAGFLLYAFCHIADGLITFFLKIPPLRFLSMVRHHRTLLERRCSRLVRLGALLFWIAFTLAKMSWLDAVISRTAAILETPLFGPVHLGSILTFLLTVWASFLISRFVRFALEEDIYKRIHLKPGLPFAVSTILHYAILLLGFYLATAALIGDINKFTILAGAFGVGIGFGLQNIVNNFVSSLIVLFERPVKIGDYVQIGTATGTVQQIGIRATILRIEDGSEIIIPNANLIANPVTNWTHTDQHRSLQIDVATTAAGVEPRRVLDLLEKAALTLPAICQTPPPQTVLTKFSPAVLTFQLRVWTTEVRDLDHLRSELAIVISEDLARNNIATA